MTAAEAAGFDARLNFSLRAHGLPATPAAAPLTAHQAAHLARRLPAVARDQWVREQVALLSDEARP